MNVITTGFRQMRLIASSLIRNVGWKGRAYIDNLQRAYLPQGIYPSQFSIILGSAPCNHKCLFCPQSINKPKKANWFDLATLRKVIKELPQEGITLNVASFSETMRCPILFPALEIMKEIRPRLQIVLATNGTQITEKQVINLIDVGLDMISVSFDAADRDNYMKLMQVDEYEKAEKSLDMICRIRTERRSSMKILTHIMAFKNQEKMFNDFKRKWECKVDTVSFRPVSNWGDEDLGLKRQLAERGFVPIYEKPKRRYPCTSLFMHMKLAVDGFYYPCVAYVPKTDYSEIQPYSLGDAKEISFWDAWNRMDAIRRKHLEGKWDECPYCRSCDVWGLWENIWYSEKGIFKLNRSMK